MSQDTEEKFDPLAVAQHEVIALANRLRAAEAREARLRPHLRHIDACLYDGWERPCTCGLVKILAGAAKDVDALSDQPRAIAEDCGHFALRALPIPTFPCPWCEQEALQKKLAKAEAQMARLRDMLVRSSRSLNEIEPWLQHHDTCGIRIDVGHESPCTCGLVAAVEQARQR